MRLQQYINEEGNIMSLQETMLFAYKNCQPFLKKVLRQGTDPYFLCSGRNKPPSTFTFVGTVRQDRKPTDTPPSLSKLIDDMMFNQYGIRGRSQAIFCFGDYRFAAPYGNPYMIFPMGEFDYLWNPGVQDLFMTLKGHTPDDMMKVLDNAMKHYKANTELSNALRTGNREIMVQCKQYFAVEFVSYSIEMRDVWNRIGNVEPKPELLHSIFGDETVTDAGIPIYKD